MQCGGAEGGGAVASEFGVVEGSTRWCARGREFNEAMYCVCEQKPKKKVKGYS